MKKIFLIGSLISAFLMLIISCSDMDSTYKEYLVPGGIIYPGKALDAKAYPGRERVLIEWVKATDPSVTYAQVFWNNYTDSVKVDMPADNDTVRCYIETIAGGTYSFMIRTYDADGNKSIPVEVLGTVYGEEYENVLVNRPIKSSKVSTDSQLFLVLGIPDVTTGAFMTEVKFTDNTGKEYVDYIPVSTDTVEYNNYKLGTEVLTRTLYIPNEACIDIFETAWDNHGAITRLDKSNWTATADSSEPNRLLPEGGPAEFAIDDNELTYWNTQIYPANQRHPYPHYLIVDMQEALPVGYVELTQIINMHDSFLNFKLQGSNDGDTWTDLGEYSMIYTEEPQKFAVQGSPQVRYLRVYAEEGPEYYAYLAEFSVYIAVE